MHYDFPYRDIPGLDFPDDNPPTLYGVKSLEGQGDENELIRQSIANPIGMDRFGSYLKPDSSVLILIDDMSRPTPADKILPHVLEEIHSAGVSKDNVLLLVALGTHRHMTEAEIATKVGDRIAGEYRVINHEWENPDALHKYGELDSGVQVVLNKHMRDADFVIGVGGITPHPAAGFSGGGKIVAPGVATEHAVGEFHWQSVQTPQADVLGVRDNPMREQIDQIAELAGLNAIVNVIQDGHGRVVRVFSGHYIDAHRAGCEFALEVFGTEIEKPDEADIFIADTHPLDQELWQGVKAMCALDCIVPDGAVVILVTPSPEGVAPQHPDVLKYGYRTLEEGRKLVEQGVSKVAAHNIVQGGRLVRRTTALIVSGGVMADEAEQLGYRKFDTPQQALEEAWKIKGKDARTIILRMGGEICPVVKE
ncbi:MAG: nickel-dependent lactate racemase [Phycisphaerae bacterium]